jgi:hypothetical protein
MVGAIRASPWSADGWPLAAIDGQLNAGRSIFAARCTVEVDLFFRIGWTIAHQAIRIAAALFFFPPSYLTMLPTAALALL